jgi:hypothetical protein
VFECTVRTIDHSSHLLPGHICPTTHSPMPFDTRPPLRSIQIFPASRIYTINSIPQAAAMSRSVLERTDYEHDNGNGNGNGHSKWDPAGITTSTSSTFASPFPTVCTDSLRANLLASTTRNHSLLATLAGLWNRSLTSMV